MASATTIKKRNNELLYYHHLNKKYPVYTKHNNPIKTNNPKQHQLYRDWQYTPCLLNRNE